MSNRAQRADAPVSPMASVASGPQQPDAVRRGPSDTVLRPLLAGLLIALLLVVNAVAMLAVDRFAFKLDMTDNQLYQLSNASEQTLHGLTAPVQITVFSAEQEFPALLREILGQYAALSHRVSLRYRDPLSHPALAQAYMERGAQIQLNDVVVEYRDRFRRYGIKDLYTLNSAGTQLATVRAEQQVTGALVQLLSPRMPTVRFTDGHDEHPSKALMAFFERNNYQAARINLAIQSPGEMGEVGDITVLAAPTQDFSEREIGLLEAQLRRGGSLMVFLAASEQAMPRLEDLLQRWGIGVTNALVHEPKAHVSDNSLTIVPMYAPHEINTVFGDKRSFVLMPTTRGLRVMDKPSFDLDVMTVLSSTPDAFSSSSADAAVASAANAKGPFALAVTAARKATAPQPPSGDGASPEPARRQTGAGRIFVSGSEKMVADDILGMGNFANAAFLAQTIHWLNPGQQTIQIPAKQIAPDPLAIRTGEATLLAIVLTAAMPLLVLLMGALVVWRRRQLR